MQTESARIYSPDEVDAKWQQWRRDKMHKKMNSLLFSLWDPDIRIVMFRESFLIQHMGQLIRYGTCERDLSWLFEQCGLSGWSGKREQATGTHLMDWTLSK